MLDMPYNLHISTVKFKEFDQLMSINTIQSKYEFTSQDG